MAVLRVRRGYKTELDPTSAQRQLLLRHCGATRFAYNWGLQRKLEEYRLNGRNLSAFDLQREPNRRKKVDLGWLYEVSKCSPQEGLRDLERSFRNFLRGRRRGRRRTFGFPRFKSKKRGPGSFRLTGRIRVGSNAIRLPRIGHVRLKEKDYLPTSEVHVFSATVSERAGRWFISLQVEEEREVPANYGPLVGVDVGLHALMTVSDGSVFENPHVLRRFERRLRRLHRVTSRKRAGSENRRKAALRVSRLHYRMSCIRRDAIHKATTTLARTKSVVVLEEIDVAGLIQNETLAKHLADAAFGEIRRQLTYKMAWYGGRLVLAERFYPSSKMCSSCGLMHDRLTLSDRVFGCAGCGLVIDRDLNAARNLRAVAARSAETPNACGAGSAGRLAPVKLPAPKQEPAQFAAPETGF